MDSERLEEKVSRPDSAILPTTSSSPQRAARGFQLHTAFYVISWMTLSCSVILFNKWILDRAAYPITLTCFHLTFASIMTQLLARTTKLIDGRKAVKMTGSTYCRAIVPIGIFYSLSLVCSNLPYLYLSVAFIQMLKGTAPIAVLLATWCLKLGRPNFKVFVNMVVIVIGIVIASFGEIKFKLNGFLYQMGGVLFEAFRLALIQRLLSSEKYKMDPLVSLYFFAPVCAAMIFILALVFEMPSANWKDLSNVGYWVILANASIAFLLNVASVFLIGKTSSLVLTLCGVLKNISLIGASMLIWGTVVTPMQFFGNGMAMAGLLYYKLGAEKVQSYVEHARSRYTKAPVLSKAIVTTLLVISCLALSVGVVASCGISFDVREYWHTLAP